MCRSSAGWRPSKSSEARTFLGLATSDSPTFAGVTSAGCLEGVYTQVTDGAVSTPDGSTSMVQTLAEGGYPSCRWVHAAAAADNRIWDAVVVGNAWSLRCVNDAYGSVLSVLGFLRTGVASCSAAITASLAVTGKTGLNGGSATTGALTVATATETALSGPSVWDGRHAVLGGPANSASAAGLGIAVNQTSSDIYTFALSPGVAWRSVYHQAANHYWMLSGDTNPTLAVLSGGVTTIYGSAPGTAGASEVRVGGGQINAVGKIATGQYFESAANSAGSPTAFNATNAEAGNYLTAVVNGSVASGIPSWVKASLIESVGANAGEGSLVLGSYRGDIKLQVGARTINALTISATGSATFGGTIISALGGGSLSILPGTVDHCYMQFFPRTATPAVRGAYIGFAASGSANVQLANEIGYHSLLSSYSTGTAGANEVRIGAGQINAASDIETATKFRVNGSDQPVSAVSFVNVNASSTADLLTVGDNEMWCLAIGNATDGYMVHAVFGKPSASSGAVMATNNNTNANLTVALVGNILRISNGVGSTRTMIYTLTKLR